MYTYMNDIPSELVILIYKYKGASKLAWTNHKYYSIFRANMASIRRTLFGQRKLDDMLISASATGDDEKIVNLLDSGADIHAGRITTREWQNSEHPLMNAAACGRTSTCKLLLDKGADIHVHNDSALAYTVFNDHPETFRLLVDNGADATGMYWRPSNFITNYALKVGIIPQPIAEFDPDKIKKILESLNAWSRRHFLG